MADEKQQKESWFKRLSFKLEHISFSQKIFLVDNLRVMLKAGLSIIESLEILEAQIERAKLKKLIGRARQDVEKGKTLAEAFEKIPELFPSIYVKMIAAGEVSGKLDESLSEAVIQMKKTYAMNSKIRGAMVYPLVILVAVVGIGIEMMVVVLPKLLTIFSEMNVPMPLPTRVLIFFSHFLITYGLFVVIVVAAFVALFIKLKRRPDVQFFLHRVLLKIPILGHISYQINLARFSLTLGSLLKSAIPIIDAVNITAEVVSNSLYKNALQNISQKIKTGVPLSELLASYPKLFPPLVSQMIMVGEHSGTLENLLNELSNYYNDEVDQLLKNISTVIEPIIIIVLGVVVGGLAVAVIMPMYSLTQAI